MNSDSDTAFTVTPKTQFTQNSSTKTSQVINIEAGRNLTHLRRVSKTGHRRVTRTGVVTYKHIETSQIMGSIQLGVQQAIFGLTSKPERDLLFQDFKTVQKSYFPRCGSKATPTHNFSDFHFETFAPMAFRHFRYLFNISPVDFLMSMCSVPMRELSNSGASGSIFFVTHDDRFIVKTVESKECRFLRRLLPGYYMNLQQNSGTLLPKFYGLFYYRCISRKVRLVVMNNLLPSTLEIHEKYDIKGSTYRRKASKAERNKSSPTFKDLDFQAHHPNGILLESNVWQSIIQTLKRDTRVLRSFKIMDYSLLIGIHKVASKDTELQVAERDSTEFFLSSVDADDGENAKNDTGPISGVIPAKNSKGESIILFLGLIDILQKFGFRKSLEHSFKSLIHDGDTVSVHRPGFYAKRFLNFASKSFRSKQNSSKRGASKKRRFSKVVRRNGPSFSMKSIKQRKAGSGKEKLAP